MKKWFQFAVLFVAPMAIAGDLILKDVKEKVWPAREGEVLGDTTIDFEWRLLADEGHPQERTFLVHVSQLRDFKQCSVRVLSESARQGREEMRKWNSTPLMSRAEFVEMLLKSEQELKRRKHDRYFEYVHVQFQTVVEHGADLTPLIKRIFAEEKGEFSPGNVTVMNKLRKAFESSKAVSLTRQNLKQQGLGFSSSMLDEFLPIVDRDLAKSWKAASELSGFGLRNSPSIVLYRRTKQRTE